MIFSLMDLQLRKAILLSGVHMQWDDQQRFGATMLENLNRKDGLSQMVNFAESQRVNGLHFTQAHVYV